MFTMTQIPRRSVVIAAALTAVAALSACGSGSEKANTSSGGGKESFTVASVSSGMPDLPLLAALDDMKSQGYDPKYVALTQSAEIAAQGVQGGRFQFGSGANNTFELAIQAGADMRMVVDREDVIWGLYSRQGVNGCSDLAGKRVAVQSQSSSTNALLESYLRTKCPGTKPKVLIIAGSENRYAAILAGQIDATPLELQDAVKLADDPRGKDIQQLADFSKELPNLNIFSQFVDNKWAKAHPQAVKDFIKALLVQARKIEGHPEYLSQLWDKYKSKFGELANGTPAAFEAYSDKFPVNGGMTREIVQYTIDFYNGTGAGIKLKPEDVMDDSYLKAVLADIGTA